MIVRSAPAHLRRALADVAAALFPGACRGCGRRLPLEGAAAFAAGAHRLAMLWDGRLERRLPGGLVLPSWLVCPACAPALRPRVETSRIGTAVECVTVFAPTPLLFALVHAFKYEAQLQLGDWFGRHLAAAARARLGDDLVLVPVPSHAQRLRERGFEATARLARAAAARSGAATAPGIVERTRATAPQARLAHAARAANVDGAFARRGRIPRRGRIVILDDVVTTGATVGAVVAALGLPPERIAVVALCRAQDPGVQDAARL